MALAGGKESKEELEIKRYIGVAPVYVLAVNPTKEQLSEIYGRDIEKDPEYVTEKDGVKTARIDFILKTNETRCNDVKLITKMSFFIQDAFKYNKEQTKTMVIDLYGRTAWATKEELKDKSIPMYKSGPANLDTNYRQCYDGEDLLTDFLKTYLQIPNVQKFDSKKNKWVMVETPADSEARLDHVADFFKGNFKELKDALNMQPNNQVKVLIGVKTTNDNRQFQDVFIQKVLHNNATKYTALESALQEKKDNGAYPNTEFEVCSLKEYGIAPTNFGTEQTQQNSDDLPW